METWLRIAAVVIGALGVIAYYRSIVRVMFLNRRERDIVELCARFVAVSVLHGLAGDGHNHGRVRRMQAWTLPLFIFLAVTTWFLLVQLSFSLIILGLNVKPEWPHAFATSGSALSTLGFSTPPSLLGEYLAVFEAAIGLAIIVLLFTFVPGYQTAIQVRERKIGWLDARTGEHPTCLSLLEWLKVSARFNDSSVWEDWEAWFRGILETHSLSPILAYVPSVYGGTNWVAASAAVLDTISLLLASTDSKNTQAERICRETGVRALRLIATELHGDVPLEAPGSDRADMHLTGGFDQFYEKLVETNFPITASKESCRDAFTALRAEYEPSVRLISKSTLMPIDEPWILPHLHAGTETTARRSGTP